MCVCVNIISMNAIVVIHSVFVYIYLMFNTKAILCGYEYIEYIQAPSHTDLLCDQGQHFVVLSLHVKLWSSSGTCDIEIT